MSSKSSGREIWNSYILAEIPILMMSCECSEQTNDDDVVNSWFYVNPLPSPISPSSNPIHTHRHTVASYTIENHLTICINYWRWMKTNSEVKRKYCSTYFLWINSALILIILFHFENCNHFLFFFESFFVRFYIQ